MRNSLLFYFNSLVLLLLVGINSWIYIHRDNGYAYAEYLTQQQLYNHSETPHIKGFQMLQLDSLEINIAINNHNENETILLKEGIHQYFISPIKDSIFLVITYVPSKTYKKNGKTRESVVEINQSSLPLYHGKMYSINDWLKTSVYTTEQEVKITKQFLVDSLHLLPEEHSIEKITKIAAYILKHTKQSNGIPHDTMDKLSPLEQFEFVKQKKSSIWCGNYADIFSFYAQCAGIKTRLVCLEGKIGEVYKAGHSFNEAYINELQQWVFIDLTSCTVFAETQPNHYLNSLEFYNLYRLAPSSVYITSYINDSIKKIHLDSTEHFYDNYFKNNQQFVFYHHNQFSNQTLDFISKVKRYIFKSPTFSVYTEAQLHDNKKFYIKQMALIALVAFIMYLIISIILIRLKRINNN